MIAVICFSCRAIYIPCISYRALSWTRTGCPRSNVSRWLTSMQRSCLQLMKSWPTYENPIVFQVDADAGSLSFGSASMRHEDDGVVDRLRRMLRTLQVIYWRFFWTEFLKRYVHIFYLLRIARRNGTRRVCANQCARCCCLVCSSRYLSDLPWVGLFVCRTDFGHTVGVFAHLLHGVQCWLSVFVNVMRLQARWDHFF